MDDFELVGRNEQQKTLFPLQRKIYTKVCYEWEIKEHMYDIIFISKYRTLEEYQQCLMDTENLSRYVIIQLKEGSVDAKALLSSKLLLYSDYAETPCINGSLLIVDKKKAGVLSMYVVTHKNFQLPPCENIYIPIQAGSKLHEDLGFLRDDKGENISELNPFLNENTALYWIWKHNTSPYVGLVHYRRYFLDAPEQAAYVLLQEKTALHLLEKYDMLVVEAWGINGMMKGQLVLDVGKKLYRQVNEVIERNLAKYQPEYLEPYHFVMTGYCLYRCNMFVTRREICGAYCKWLFSFILEAYNELDFSGCSVKEQRALGFFSERLFTTWLLQQDLRIKEMPIVELK